MEQKKTYLDIDYFVFRDLVTDKPFGFNSFMGSTLLLWHTLLASRRVLPIGCVVSVGEGVSISGSGALRLLPSTTRSYFFTAGSIAGDGRVGALSSRVCSISRDVGRVGGINEGFSGR